MARMKAGMWSAPVVLLAGLVAGSATARGWGQEVPAFNSAQVNADHTITFRYDDPNAKKVELSTDITPGPLEMRKGADGLWAVTTEVLPAEIYGYSFVVDGRPEYDPKKTANVLPNLSFRETSVLVPGAVPEPWEEQEEPHGTTRIHRYTTHVVKGLPGDQSEYVVYTPPGYDAAAKTPYPTLYLLHGWGQTDRGWTQDQQADLILDWLLAKGKIRPMVVVMPLGYGQMSFVQQGFGIWRGSPEPVNRNTEAFAQALLTEVMPRVEAEYRVSKRREDRAIAGLSMGGLESLTVGLKHTEMFAYVGGFSAAVHLLKPEQIPLLSAPDAAKKADLKVLWVACGKGDSLIAANRALAGELKGAGLPVTEVETEGAHVSYVWRDNLIHFAPLLFGKK